MVALKIMFEHYNEIFRKRGGLYHKDVFSDDTAKIAKSIVSLAKTLGLQTVAEGVENERQKEVMRSIGCDFIQGYGVGKPVPADKITREMFATVKQ